MAQWLLRRRLGRLNGCIELEIDRKHSSTCVFQHLLIPIFIHAVRDSPASFPLLPPLQTVPFPPRSVAVTSTGVDTFLVPSDDGNTAILDYTVEVVCTTCGKAPGDAGNQKVTHPHSPIQTTLDPGETYEVYVTARNAVGSSVAASSSAVAVDPVSDPGWACSSHRRGGRSRSRGSRLSCISPTSVLPVAQPPLPPA